MPDITKISFYIASRLANADAVGKLNFIFKSMGWECLHDWTAYGDVRHDEGAMQVVSHKELCAARDCDVFLLLLPGGRGAHVELGAHLQNDLPNHFTFVYSADPKRDFHGPDASAFYHHPNVHRLHGPMTSTEFVSQILSVMNRGMV